MAQPQMHLLEEPIEIASPLGVSPEDIVRGVIRAIPLIVILAVIAVGLTMAWIRWGAARYYTAQMTVAPYSANLRQQHSTVLGLAGLAPITNQQFRLYLATRTSVQLAAQLLEEPSVREEIFAGQWNPQSKTWHRPATALSSLKWSVKKLLHLPPWSPPTAADLSSYIARKIKVASNVSRTRYTFSFSSRDPAFAIWLLGQVDERAQTILRQKARARTELRINHLMHQITATTVVVNRDVLVTLLAEQQQRLMLINPKLPYAAVVVDPPSVSHYPTSPRPLWDLVLAAIGAAILGICLAAWNVRRRALRRARQLS